MPEAISPYAPSHTKSLPKAKFIRQQEDFHSDCNTEDKERQRNFVADFFCSHSNNIRLLSLPGEQWTFERMLCERANVERIVGFESSLRTWSRSTSWIPRKHNGLYRHRWWLSGPNRYVPVYETDVAASFNLDLCWFLATPCKPSHWSQPGTWKRYRRFNSVWIDGFSPLGCESSAAIIRGVAGVAASPLAAAFSFLIGRDDPAVAAVVNSCPGSTALERRASFIGLLIDAAGADWTPISHMQHHSFNSDGNVNFGTVAGIVKKRT